MLPTPSLRPMTRDELRSIDQRAISEFGMSGLVLMENAGRNAAAIIAELASTATSPNVFIISGKGNNGGDGFVIARHLELAGLTPRVFLIASPESLSPNARANYDILTRSGHSPTVIESDTHFTELRSSLTTADIIVDAMIGTGLRGSARGSVAEGIRYVNQARQARMVNTNQHVVSIDIPSGMDCDAGFPEDDSGSATCVRADLTITFVSSKVSFHSANSQPFLGEVHVVGIGAPMKLLTEFSV